MQGLNPANRSSNPWVEAGETAPADQFGVVLLCVYRGRLENRAVFSVGSRLVKIEYTVAVSPKERSWYFNRPASA